MKPGAAAGVLTLAGALLVVHPEVGLYVDDPASAVSRGVYAEAAPDASLVDSDDAGSASAGDGDGADSAGDLDSGDSAVELGSGYQCSTVPGDCRRAPLAWTARATVTAYCESGVMRSGRRTYVGAVATDRAVIPEGSLIEIEGVAGVHVSEDTGSGVRGYWIDRYMTSCADAVRWGRQTLAIRVTRWGW